MKGKVIIVSAPSGAGKSTIVKYLTGKIPNLAFSVSATSRSPRPGEIDGEHYHFLTESQFRRGIDEGIFIEWEEVYPGLLYGTVESDVNRVRNSGRSVIFDVDVKGGINLKERFGDEALAIFIMPPSVDELERRLTARGTEKEETIRMRTSKAATEIEYANRFDEVIVNDDLDMACDRALSVTKRFIETI